MLYQILVDLNPADWRHQTQADAAAVKKCLSEAEPLPGRESPFFL